MAFSDREGVLSLRDFSLSGLPPLVGEGQDGAVLIGKGRGGGCGCKYHLALALYDLLPVLYDDAFI